MLRMVAIWDMAATLGMLAMLRMVAAALHRMEARMADNQSIQVIFQIILTLKMGIGTALTVMSIVSLRDRRAASAKRPNQLLHETIDNTAVKVGQVLAGTATSRLCTLVPGAPSTPLKLATRRHTTIPRGMAIRVTTRFRLILPLVGQAREAREETGCLGTGNVPNATNTASLLAAPVVCVRPSAQIRTCPAWPRVLTTLQERPLPQAFLRVALTEYPRRIGNQGTGLVTTAVITTLRAEEPAANVPKQDNTLPEGLLLEVLEALELRQATTRLRPRPSLLHRRLAPMALRVATGCVLGVETITSPLGRHVENVE